MPDPDLDALIDRRAPMLGRDPRRGLTLEGVPLALIADAVGTPSWVYAAGAFRARFDRLAATFGAARVHYAVKANDHLALLDLVARAGGGADVVSAGELLRARAAGIPAARIVFSGVGKTAAELALAVATGIGQVNLESVEELELLGAIAAREGRRQAVALRVNPDVGAGGHHKITTGRAGDKFGIPLGEAEAAYARAAALPGLRPVGLAFHIGSQIMEPEPFGKAARRVAAAVDRLRASGHEVGAVDCGGGLGIGYGVDPDGDPVAWRDRLVAALGGRGLALSVEPGRWLVGPCGVLLARAIRTKAASPRPFLVLDAAMNDLLRPSLYDAWHGIIPVAAEDLARAGGAVAHEVVGPVCETGDVLAHDRALPPLADGAAVAILDAGAYGAAMSSTYNARPLAAQVLVEHGEWRVIRPRQAVEALWRDERVPPRPAGGPR